MTIEAGRLLAEILRLQHWAGGEAVDAARMFGLMHGFETVLDEDTHGEISEQTQRHIEDILDDVERGKQSADPLAIKGRLCSLGIDESVAGTVMQLCFLQSRFLEGIEKIVSAPGSCFRSLKSWKPPESEWYGALHYMQLFDTTEGARKPMHAAFGPCVPRVGEIIEPEAGSRMKVVAVEYEARSRSESEGDAYSLLVPSIVLKAVEQR